MELLIQHELQQLLLVVPVLKIFGKKLPLHVLSTIVNTSSDQIFLPRNRHLGELKPLSNTDYPLKSLVVSEVMYAIASDQVDTQWIQSKNSSYNQCGTTNDLKPVPKTSVLKPGAIQIHRQVHLSNAKLLKETEIKLYEMLWKYDAIISKSG